MISIINSQTGERQIVGSLDGYDDEWSAEGPPLPDVDDGLRPELILVEGEWCEDPARVQATLIAQVKAQAESLTGDLYTVSPAKMLKYAAKQAEVERWQSLGADDELASAALETMDTALRDRSFPYAIADAAAFGDDIPAAIMRFRSGIDAAESRSAAIEATEQSTVDAIKRADGVEAMRAVVAATEWSISQSDAL